MNVGRDRRVLSGDAAARRAPPLRLSRTVQGTLSRGGIAGGGRGVARVRGNRREATDMADRVLRGSRLGTTSYETDRNTDLAPRQQAVYDCPHGHAFGVPLSSDAEIPPSWD